MDGSGEDNATTNREDEIENSQQLEEQPRQPPGRAPYLIPTHPYLSSIQPRLD